MYSLDEYAFDRQLLFSGEVVEERISDPGMDGRNRADMLENGEKSFLDVPLIYEGRPIGFLVFIETEVERHFSDDERRLAVRTDIVAQRIAETAEFPEVPAHGVPLLVRLQEYGTVKPEQNCYSSRGKK